MKSKPDKRQLVMQAAERLFTSRRFHEITVDDVAAEAGIAKGTVYTHFADKNDLFFQTATNGFEELCELLARKVPEEGSFVERLEGACREIRRFFDHRRPLLQMMQAEDGRMSYCKGSLRHRWREKRKRLVASVAAIIDKGVADGSIRGDVPAEVLANILLGMLRTQARDLIDASTEMRHHQVIVELFCNGAWAAKEKNKNHGQGARAT